MLLNLALCLTAACGLPEGVVSISTGVKGSGFVVAATHSKSAVVTNAHVCIPNYQEALPNRAALVPALEATVTGNSGTSEEVKILADVVAIDLNNDLCLIIAHGYLKPLRISEGSNLLPNEALVVLSPNPLPKSTAQFIGQDKATDGWAAVHKSSYALLGTNFMFGQSGSAVVNRSGEVVGVFWGKNRFGDEGYMVGLDALKRFLDASLFTLYQNVYERHADGPHLRKKYD